MPKPPKEKQIGAPNSVPSGEAGPLNAQPVAYPAAAPYATRYNIVETYQMREMSIRFDTVPTYLR